MPNIGPTMRGKGKRWMVLVDGAGTPLGAYLEAPSAAEVRLLKHPLEPVPGGRPGKPGCPRNRQKQQMANRDYESHLPRLVGPSGH